MNPLDDYPNIRKWIYTAFWVLALVQGGCNVAFLAVGELPVWLVVINVVVPFVGGYIGYTAKRNVNTVDPRDPVS